jgi:putative sterol carrier protein
MKPATFREGIQAMPHFFAADQMPDLDAIIHFEVTGSEPGSWLLVIRDGRCQVREAHPDGDATLTIRTPSDAWLAIMRRELNPIAAFMSLRMTATGDVTILHRLGRMFPFGQPPRQGR